ncbi:CPBP family intramembrane glutamic endopeptidase [Clostridium hydrogenum]|uniref:CPBP family intramembrane glutamic endopeptidase n=1 Tax=Clostridium hydrogenum TaxID=2855764 RepID=UPI001F35B0EA|nr:type II CAAX endopeptidase family protein [Clostridium hydrogenum]
MEGNLEQIKKEVCKVLILIFSITYFMGIVLFLVYKNMDKSAGQYFALVQMLYPAFAVICMKLYFEKDKISKEIEKFFKAYIVFFAICMITLITGVFAYRKYVMVALYIIVGVFSLISFFKIISDKKKNFEKINMTFNKNMKVIVIMALIFIALKLISWGISVGISGVSNKEIVSLITSILTLPVSLIFGVIFSFIMFFGEELGWRGYLQPRLQTIFGKKMGVVLLGIIWGMWHLPLCITLYGPKTPIYCIIMYPFICTFLGIFLGLAYMKTGNLWSTIILHIINNSLAVSANGGQYDMVITIKSLIIGIAIEAILFVPFIFAKEYKNSESNETTQLLQ